MPAYLINEDKSLVEGMTKEETNKELEIKQNVIEFGTTAGTVCQGNDARLKDARTPKAHTHDDRYYTETEAIQLFKEQGDFVVLTGQVTYSGLQGTTYLPYPSGFNKGNTIVISVMGNRTETNEAWHTYVSNHNVTSVVTGSALHVGLWNDKIQISKLKCDVGEQDTTSNFKIVLMRVPVG